MSQDQQPLPPNLREAVEIMADAVQGMYVFTDNRECIEAECAAALRALHAGGFVVEKRETVPVPVSPYTPFGPMRYTHPEQWSDRDRAAYLMSDIQKNWHDGIDDDVWVGEFLTKLLWAEICRLPSAPAGAADER